MITESFGRILLNLEIIIGTVPSYLGNWGKRVNFGNSVTEIQRKYEREREKVEEKKFWISVITLLKFLLPNLLTENQLWQCHYRNRGNKNLWQCHCRKWEEKKNKKWLPKSGEELKKKLLRPQYFYNKL